MNSEKKYKVKVGDSFFFELNIDALSTADILPLSESRYHLLQENRSFHAEVTTTDFLNRKYAVRINGNSYEVQIANPLDQLIEEMGLSLGAAQVIKDIKAPMPGLILDVQVKDGDTVKEGDYLLVLEAMKMENALTAPRDGVVKAVKIKQGQTVEKNQLLIEME